MSLSKQIHLYSLSTDDFYTEKETNIHNKLLKLYKIKKNNHPKWYLKIISNIIKKYKNEIILNMENHLKLNQPRNLVSDRLKEKYIVSLFESSLTRALKINTNQLTDKIFIINVYFFQVFEDLVKNGFIYNNQKYIFLTASAGQIRTKRAVFIQENAYNEIKNKIMCGLSIEKINEMGGINRNKFLAYIALANSATDVWEDFDIDKSIVVDDFENFVKGTVDFIDEISYTVDRKIMSVPINQNDGAGIMLDKPTRMCRLPFIKGLMIYFPFDRFIKEKCPDEDCTVYDIYGTPHKIIEENIKYIFTKSQFKLCK